MIDLCIENFNPDVGVVCEVTRLKNFEPHRDKNLKIDEINNLIKLHYSNKPSLKISFLNANIKNAKSTLTKDKSDSNGYNFLYVDNVRLNYQHGVPLLKNCFFLIF